MSNGSRWAALTKPLCLVGFLILAAGARAQLANPDSWQAESLQEHPLVGVIYDTAAQRVISPRLLEAAFENSSYLLLGEKHDNPDHHRLQRHLLAHLIQTERLANVTFEMMDGTVRERLLDITLQPPMSDDELRSYLLWDEKGWDWEFYGPLVELIYDAGIPLSAGNISRSLVSDIYASEAVGEDQILDSATIQRLTQAIDESHCGLLPESQFPAMVRVQQARDQAMANALRRPEAGQTSVLIAGNFHVREDLGVPLYLQRREPSMADTAVTTVAFLEVSEDNDDPASYLEAEAPEYDYLWFTPAVDNEDYCASLR